jgi:hypothetical protein
VVWRREDGQWLWPEVITMAASDKNKIFWMSCDVRNVFRLTSDCILTSKLGILLAVVVEPRIGRLFRMREINYGYSRR